MPYYRYIRICKKCSKEYKLENAHGSKYCRNCRRDLKLIHNKEFYPSTFYFHRPIVLKRDLYKCRNCGIKKSERELHIHHIDTNKKNNSFSNLITLCEKCHLMLHGTYENKVLAISDIFVLFKEIKGKKYKEKFEFLNKIKIVKSVPKIFRGIDGSGRWKLMEK